MDKFQNYFMYKGKAYGIGTKVIFKPTVEFDMCYLNNSKSNDPEVVKREPHTFFRGCTNGRCEFEWCESIYDSTQYQYQAHSRVTTFNPDADILKIVEPIEVELVSWQHKAIQNMFSGKASVDVFGGVLIYIVVMCVGAIFKDNWLIWIVATIVFIAWLLNQYRE